MSEEKVQINSNLERQARHKIITFPYRNTTAGGKDDTLLISLRTGNIIPSNLHLSRSGSHGSRNYKLLPAKYLMYKVKRSNLGNTYIIVSIILLKEDGAIETLFEWKLYEGKKNRILLGQLPEKIEQILLSSKEQLPLFNYIYNFG